MGGIAEPAVILATLALLVMTPAGTTAFWPVAGALAALVTVQVIFWAKTQPVNGFYPRGGAVEKHGADHAASAGRWPAGEPPTARRRHVVRPFRIPRRGRRASSAHASTIFQYESFSIT